MLELGRSSQKLYLPEFLPDDTRPADLPGSNAPERADGVSECYGTLRYGKLLEALLFENRRYTTLTGSDAVLIHPDAEKWLIDRMAAEEAAHVINVSATIFGWSAGKWMEWYPDIREGSNLITARPKYMWQEGWFAQHNRLLSAASGMKRNAPLFICGDLHVQAEGRIVRSGNLDLSKNPVVVIASGSLGTGPQGFPSGAIRKMVPQVPTDLVVKEGLPPVEKNGFVILDITPEKIAIDFYIWRPPDPIEAIDTLQPHHRLELIAPSSGQGI
jgi:phosphodiesterase/alkaline phosphatase D-like protein